MVESTPPVHEDEVPHDVNLVRRLIASQYPEWSDLEVRPAPNPGTSNALYRLGAERVVRLPRVEYATESITREARWLPHLAPSLPLAIPEPLGLGRPEYGYPWSWAVYRWLDGTPLAPESTGSVSDLAGALANFLRALHSIDRADAPTASRGGPLRERDDATRAAIEALRDQYPPESIRPVWERALAAPDWDRDPVWLHGDLLPSNLLQLEGRLHAVIDFGGLGVGDPASDLACAWSLIPTQHRSTFREQLEVDDATWERARGWALSIALIIIPYYRDTHAELTRIAEHTIDAVLADPPPSAL